MEIEDLKQYIINNQSIDNILENIGCHHIRQHDGYYTCGNQDGDNVSAITVYCNDNITVINYTRQMTKNKIVTDIFDLIMYNQNITFPESIKYVCELLGLDYYSGIKDRPESISFIQMIYGTLTNGCDDCDASPLKPINEQILTYYLPYGNQLFEDDGISLEIQHEFNIGYDTYSNRITIPIRDSLGELVGVKGRLFQYEINDNDEAPKYLYLEKCNKSKLLYGAYENKEYIKNNNYLYIVEAEKGVLQLASYGIRNCVATCGKTISKTQIELIVRTGCSPIFAFDKDVQLDEIEAIAEKFVDGIEVYAIIDTDDILHGKESPSDNYNKFLQLSQNIQRIK